MSTSTARDAERVPDALGVHRVTTFRQASRVASDRAYGFSVFRRSAPGPALAVAVADADDGRRPAVQRNHHQRGERPSR